MCKGNCCSQVFQVSYRYLFSLNQIVISPHGVLHNFSSIKENFTYLVIGVVICALLQAYNKGYSRYVYLNTFDTLKSKVLLKQFKTFYAYISLFGLMALFLLVRSVDDQNKLLFLLGFAIVLNGLATTCRLQFFKQYVQVEKLYVYAFQAAAIGFPLIYYGFYQFEIFQFINKFGVIYTNESFLGRVSFPRGILSTVLLSLIFYVEGGVLIFQHLILGQKRKSKDIIVLKNLQQISYVHFIHAVILVFGPIIIGANSSIYFYQWVIVLNALYFFIMIFRHETNILFMSYKKSTRTKRMQLVLCHEAWNNLCSIMNNKHPFLNSAYAVSDLGRALNIDDENVTKLIRIECGMTFNTFLIKLRLLYLVQKGSGLSSQYQHTEELIRALGFSSTFDFQKEVLVTFGISYKALLYEPKKFNKRLHKLYPWLSEFNFEPSKKKVMKPKKRAVKR